jgi:hypothetical protein
MFKSKAIGAIFGALVLSCMPAVATTISSEDPIEINLGGGIRTGELSFLLQVGDVATLKAAALPGDLLFVFAYALDQWNEPDLGNVLTLYLGYPADGQIAQSLVIPKGIEGMIFKVLAVAMDPKGEMRSSNEMTVAIAGVQILQPAVDPAPVVKAAELPAE